MVKFLQVLALSFVTLLNVEANPQAKQNQRPGQNQQAPATEQQNILIELNRLEQKDNNCVTYFMIKNNTNFNFSKFQTEMVTFDKNGLINNRILGDFQKIRPNKTVVKLFAIPDAKCSTINKILINDVHICKADTEQPMDCLDLLQPSNKAKIKLFK